MTRTFWGIFLALLILAVLAWWVFGHSQRYPEKGWFGSNSVSAALLA